MNDNILDDFSFENPPKFRYANGITALILLMCLVIWFFLYQAGNLPYDDNFGCLIFAFLLSLFIAFALLVLFLWKKNYYLPHAIVIATYILTSSPPIIYLVVTNYAFIFGKTLAV